MRCSVCTEIIEGRIYYVDKQAMHWLCRTKYSEQHTTPPPPPPFLVGDAVRWCTCTGRGGRPIDCTVVRVSGKSATIKVLDKTTKRYFEKTVRVANLVKVKEGSSKIVSVGAELGYMWGN